MRDLFRGYNKLIRPVQNMTQKVEVAFGLAFIQLINVVSLQKQQHRYSLLKVGLIFVASYTSEPESPTKKLKMASQETIPSFYECSPLLVVFVSKKQQYQGEIA